MFLNRDFPLTGVRILAGKTFSFKEKIATCPQIVASLIFIICVRIQDFAVSSRVVEPNCLHAKYLSRLPGYPRGVCVSLYQS